MRGEMTNKGLKVPEQFIDVSKKGEAMGRLPTIESALLKLVSSGIDVRTVIDVGVLTGTDFLVKSFPNAKHHLFEPVDSFFDTIRTSYQGVDYELHQLAASSSSGSAFQVEISADNSGRITHSYLSDEEAYIGEATNQGVVINCKSIRKVRLDDFFSQRPLSGGYVVKIDVDGHEMPIIRGGQSVLKGADVVIVEAPMHELIERANAIVGLGFELMEIVDLCYYRQLLSQVDLVFVNKTAVNRYPDLRPWATKEFSFDQWQVLQHK